MNSFRNLYLFWFLFGSCSTINIWNFWEDLNLPTDCVPSLVRCDKGTEYHCIPVVDKSGGVIYLEDCIKTIEIGSDNCAIYERTNNENYIITQRKCKESLKCPKSPYVSTKIFKYNCTTENVVTKSSQFNGQRETGLSSDDVAAYNRNAKAFSGELEADDVTDYYDNWVDQYDYDLAPERYNGPAIAADVVDRYHSRNRGSATILDVAAGTGFVGEELIKRGFKTIDALDPSEKMLKKAKTKNIYRHLICEYLTGERLPIAKDSYDSLVSSGGFGNGHIPCEALYEIIRITKPGGTVITVMREEYLGVEMYRDKLETLMNKLQSEGKWVKIERKIVQNYFYDNPGVVFVYKVL